MQKLALLGLAALFHASDVTAQQPVVDLGIRLIGESGANVSGALIALIDKDDRVVTEELSREDGTRVLRAPPGEYRVRVRRIGYAPFRSDPVVLPHRGVLVLHLDSRRVALRTVVVNEKSRCRAMDNETGPLWEEISKALRASQLTFADLWSVPRSYVYHSELSPDGRVLKSDTLVRSIRDQKPFGSPDPGKLAAEGYVRGNESDGWEYFGPDERVLLSEQFQATHCFRVTRDRKRRGQVGLAFAPVAGRRLADIAGTVWVDETSGELQEITFRYANAGLLSTFEAGGVIGFTRLESGAWVVSQWRLRAPRLRMARENPGIVDAVGYIEDGGGIILSPGSRR